MVSNPTVTSIIPEGRPKSGRVWKVKQVSRSSAQNRCGVLSHLKKTYDERKKLKEDRDSMKALERQMKEEKQMKIKEMKEKREEKKKIKMANEFKNSVYQVLKPEKIKKMSKKQLRMVKKTAMNKNGQVELVNPWTNSSN